MPQHTPETWDEVVAARLAYEAANPGVPSLYDADELKPDAGGSPDDGLHPVGVSAPGAGTFTRDDPGSSAFGYIANNGHIYGNNSGATAWGNIYGNNTTVARIRADNVGSTAFGYVSAWSDGQTPLIDANGNGSLAHGYAYGGTATEISTGNAGATAFGFASSDGKIRASYVGSTAFGRSRDASSQIWGRGNGATAFGYARDGGVIQAGTSPAATAFGYAIGASALIQAGGRGSLAGGQVEANSTISASGNYARGGFAFGVAEDGGSIISQNPGTIAMGMVWGGSNSEIRAGDGTSGYGGAFAGGYAYGGLIASEGPGSFAFGRVVDWANGNTAQITADAYGSWAGGWGYYGRIEATGRGSFAHGIGRQGGVLRASQTAGHAFGYASGTGAQLYSTQVGALASGSVFGTNSTLTAGGVGSVAFGRAVVGGTIEASGSGSLAVGYANNASIVASASGSAQFGVGTNTVANSLAVGTGLRMNADGAPGTPRDGDMWVAANYVYVRSNGVSVKIT